MDLNLKILRIFLGENKNILCEYYSHSIADEKLNEPEWKKPYFRVKHSSLSESDKFSQKST